jgi:hypothetical protein
MVERSAGESMIDRPLSNRVASAALLYGMVILGAQFFAPGLRAADAPRKVAFLVGIRKYQKPPFPDLDWAENDVAEMKVALEQLGFEVRLLTGGAQGKDQATRRNILAALNEMVRPLGKEDLILVMLSGHGQQFRYKEPDPDAPKKQREREDAFFCPVDAVNQEPGTLISLSHVTDKVLANNVGRRLVLVDACRDAPKDPNKGAKGIQGRQIALPEDTAVLFSCKAGQQSWENDDLKHSLFSYCVLESLRGYRGTGDEITWTSLVDQVTNRMASADMKTLIPADRIQTPIAAGGVERTVLGKRTSQLPNVLKYKLQKGDRFLYRITDARKTSSDFYVKTDTESTMETVTSQVVDDADDRGIATLRIKIVSCKFVLDSSQFGKFEFDSKTNRRDNTSSTGAVLTPFLERLTGSEYKRRVSPRGELLKVEGYADVFTDLVKDKPDIRAYVAYVPIDDAGAKFSGQAEIVIFGDKPVQRGDRWEVPIDDESASRGKVKGSVVYVHEGDDKFGDRRTIRLSAETSMSIDSSTDVTGSKLTAKLKSGDSNQVVQFDPVAGRIVFSKRSVSMAGKLMLNDLSGDMTSVQTYTVQLLDKLPD